MHVNKMGGLEVKYISLVSYSFSYFFQITE